MNYYNCCIIFIFSRLYVTFDPICNIVIYLLLVLYFATVICVLSIKVKKKHNKCVHGTVPRDLLKRLVYLRNVETHLTV